jgi:hypothetical protein
MENTINKLIETKNLYDRADLIKLALSKDVNKNLVEAEIASKDEASLKRFETAKEKFDAEQAIYFNSSNENKTVVVDKHIDKIVSILEKAGL